MAHNRNPVFSDKKLACTISVALLCLLLLAFVFSPISGRIVGAILLLPAAAISLLCLKKRSILSIHKKIVLLIMSVMGLLYISLYYLTGIGYGLYYAAVRLSLSSFFKYILPITLIIIASEIIRRILLSQESKAISAASYFICVFSEILIDSSLRSVHTFNQLIDLLGYTVFPAVTANVLYHYLSQRYGAAPNISYRLITSLFPYIIPYTPKLSAALYAFARLTAPLLILGFIVFLYGNKKKYALKKRSKWPVVLGSFTAILMISFVMLISCQFKYGLIVIATESMTDEINKGDAIIYTAYKNQPIEKGQILVFEKNKVKVIHRVVDIQNINGVTRYYTKGDANQESDPGYITEAEIIGLTDMKIPYIGMPTIWMHQLYS